MSCAMPKALTEALAAKRPTRRQKEIINAAANVKRKQNDSTDFIAGVIVGGLL